MYAGLVKALRSPVEKKPGYVIYASASQTNVKQYTFLAEHLLTSSELSLYETDGGSRL